MKITFLIDAKDKMMGETTFKWFEKYKVEGFDGLVAHSLQSFLYDYCSYEVTDLILDLDAFATEPGHLRMSFSGEVGSPIEKEKELVLFRSSGQPNDAYSAGEIDSIFKRLRMDMPAMEKTYNVKIRMSPPPRWAVEVMFNWS
jgi:hypothetical protein